jgi:hypothetical protein
MQAEAQTLTTYQARLAGLASIASSAGDDALLDRILTLHQEVNRELTEYNSLTGAALNWWTVDIDRITRELTAIENAAAALSNALPPDAGVRPAVDSGTRADPWGAFWDRLSLAGSVVAAVLVILLLLWVTK